MRTYSFVAAALCVVALPTASLFAQSSESGDSTYRPPESVAGKTLDEWIKDIKHPDPGVRVEALKAVLQFGEDSRRAVPEVIDLLNREFDASVKVYACIVLWTGAVRNTDVPAAVRALVRRMSEDREAIVRYHAALALGRFKEEAGAAIPDLIRATRDRSAWEIRQAAIGSLAKAAADPASGPDPLAIKALVACLRDASAKVRLEAVMGLGSLGPPRDRLLREGVIRALTAMLGDRDKRVAVWAYVGLMYVDQDAKEKEKEEYLDGLAQLLINDDVPTRGQAARGLGVLGKDARSKVPQLLSALKDKELSVSTSACWALGEMGRQFDPGSEVTTTLNKLVKSTTADAALRQMAVAALDRIKGRTDTAIEEKPKDAIPAPKKKP